MACSRPLAASVAVALLVGGCGPGIAELVATGRYQRAMCKAFDGSPTTRDEVARAFADAKDTRWRVHVLTEAELQPILGPATAQVLARARFVEVTLERRFVGPPGGRLTDWSVVELQDQRSRPVAAPDWPALARATGEPLPGAVTARTYVTGGNVLRGAAALATGGLSTLFTKFRARESTAPAAASEYQRLAPLATALRARLGGDRPALTSCEQPQCRWAFVVPLPSPALRLRAEVHHIVSIDGVHVPCVSGGTWGLSLGPAEALGETARRLFGDGRPRRLLDGAELEKVH